VVWLPEPCADEMPDPEPVDDPELAEPELLDDPEPPVAELDPDEPLEPLPAEEEEAPVPVPLAVVVLVWCAPGSATAITPAPTRPAMPTVAVAARSRAWPCRLAAAADRMSSGSAEFIGFPPCLPAQSWTRTWGSPRKRL
jgi:hypothetical protein